MVLRFAVCIIPSVKCTGRSTGISALGIFQDSRLQIALLTFVCPFHHGSVQQAVDLFGPSRSWY